MVEVKDSGCGIPTENIKKLFVHFFTNKPDGLGMGLSISRSIVEHWAAEQSYLVAGESWEKLTPDAMLDVSAAIANGLVK